MIESLVCLQKLLLPFFFITILQIKVGIQCCKKKPPPSRPPPSHRLPPPTPPATPAPITPIPPPGKAEVPANTPSLARDLDDKKADNRDKGDSKDKAKDKKDKSSKSKKSQKSDKSKIPGGSSNSKKKDKDGGSQKEKEGEEPEPEEKKDHKDDSFEKRKPKAVEAKRAGEIANKGTVPRERDDYKTMKAGMPTSDFDKSLNLPKEK